MHLVVASLVVPVAVMLLPTQSLINVEERRSPASARLAFAPEECTGHSRDTPVDAQDGPADDTPLLHELTVSLILCPEVPRGTRYELVRRCEDGNRQPLFAGVVTSDAPSLNLAKVRYRGARLGATEVVLVLPQGHAIAQPTMP